MRATLLGWLSLASIGFLCLPLHLASALGRWLDAILGKLSLEDGLTGH